MVSLFTCKGIAHSQESKSLPACVCVILPTTLSDLPTILAN